MKNKNKKTEQMLNAMGNGAREVYLADNPHGFRCVHKVHKSKKQYSRKNNKINF